VLGHVPRELTITVTSSPSRGIDATLHLAERLAAAGYRVVPHLAARLVLGQSHLEHLLARIDALGVHEVFVVAGDIDEAQGPFEGAAPLLRAMAELGHRPDEIGITGYPESHAFISDDTTIQAMFEKAPYATYIVSQICFDPALVGEWIHRVRDRGIKLPIYVGLPGPSDPVRLFALSRRIGLGESARFLRRHGNWIKRLTLPRGYDPTALLAALAPHLSPLENRIAGLHLFTFNELAQTEAWRQREIARLLVALDEGRVENQ
jgi:methylenetetrahydrofolate reductase (NADPH)